ncbi:MAG TPA: 23S rRNA (adenine(2030)-N(6))-methyltransferase RlmJ [Hyphomicrobiaceae bacterium]|jgi:23S rRNA (adenine2030-N6)-methyltransferase|nr:23S rRNA (adenine(2030)-N(6))-methyltransferase RlmJ [Hyphomicrobiaceae bacterium]
MNYRHAYHAGNFADVVKHWVFALAIDYLKRKEAPFRVIDTHAGRGRYLLSAAEANKTREWREGIARLIGPDAKPLPPELAQGLKVYLDVVRGENAPGALTSYPGSPAIAQALLRAQDTLVVNEAHPEELQHLTADLRRRRGGSVKLLGLDGWMGLRALLPPPERRGVILIDPPFEEAGELHRLVSGLKEGLARFATGVFIAWYPIKDGKAARRLLKSVAEIAVGKLISLEVLIRQPRNPEVLNGCGLIVANPPFTLESKLNAVAPALARRLAAGPGANCSVRWVKALRTD